MKTKNELTEAQRATIRKVYADTKNKAEAARRAGVSPTTARDFIYREEREGVPPLEASSLTIAPVVDDQSTRTLALRLLKAKAHTLEELAQTLKITKGQALDLVEGFKGQSLNLHQFGDKFTIDREPAPGVPVASDARYVYTSRPDGWYVFGVTSDNHISSKYERLDVLEDLYTKFADARVDRVFNCGNWIDGEARFNKHDLLVHGIGNQINRMLDKYPQREGLTTYYVAGDDHEGWYCQSMGIDIGDHLEQQARKRERFDLSYLGYIEAFVSMTHAKSGAVARLLVCHPGGGSSYALSYTSQKSVEAYEGGEKPAIALYGHYHKLEYCYVRNVHAIQVGTTEDQTPFMRKKKLAAHIGGVIVRAHQDEQGAIDRCQVEFLTYFNKGYYNHQWNMAGEVTKNPLVGRNG